MDQAVFLALLTKMGVDVNNVSAQELDDLVGNVVTSAQARDHINDTTIHSAQEGVEDIVGAMLSGNTETGIAVTYDDVGGKINFDASHNHSGVYEPAGDVATHAALTTGIHGVGAGTVAKVGDIATDANLSVAAQAVVTAGPCDTDSNLSVAAQAVVTAGACDVDANLSVAAQAAISASHSNALDHTQNSDTGTTGTTFTVDSDSSTGKISVVAAAGADKTLTLTNVALTDDRTVSIPDYTGFIPLVIAHGATQTSATNGTADVTGSSLTLASGWLKAGKSIRWTIAGTISGTNAAKSVILYVDDAAIITLTTASVDAGSWQAVLTLHEYTDAANQKCTGVLCVNNSKTICAYVADTTDFADGGATTVKAQIVSGNAGDTIKSEVVLIEYLP